MAIALEFIDFVVPIRVIREKYPGGWDQCLRDHARLIGGTVWYDDHLFRDGGMSPGDAEDLVDRWAGLGFDVMGVRDGRRVWKDVCVVEGMFGGPTLPCDWIVVVAERQIAYLKDHEPGAVVGRGAPGLRGDA